MGYLKINQLNIDDIIYGDGCGNDGLHPSDYVPEIDIPKSNLYVANLIINSVLSV